MHIGVIIKENVDWFFCFIMKKRKERNMLHGSLLLNFIYGSRKTHGTWILFVKNLSQGSVIKFNEFEFKKEPSKLVPNNI
jgi:hypothetical protein